MNEIGKIFCSPQLRKDEFIAEFGEGYSNLYLLRKDVYWCRGIDAITKTKIIEQAGAPFAAFILIRVLSNYIVFISGIDYQNYIKKYFNITVSKKEFEVLNHLRNALEHQSYNLVWEPDEERGESGKTVYFAMTEEKGSPLAEKIDETPKDETWVINIEILHREIEASIKGLYKLCMEEEKQAKEILTRTKNHGMHVIPKEVFISYSRSRQESKNLLRL